MRNVFLLGLSGLLWGCATAVGATDPQFGPESSKGLFIKPLVRPDGITLTLVPVNLDNHTYGTPFLLRGRAEWNIEAASNRTGRTHHLYYAGYYLDPGDYAVLSMDTEMIAAGRDIRYKFCYARFSEVLSVRAGEATIWRIMPISITTWPAYFAALHKNDQNGAELERFQQSIDGIPNFHPTALRVVPTEFVNFAGETRVDARDCVPRSFEVVHRVEDAAFPKAEIAHPN